MNDENKTLFENEEEATAETAVSDSDSAAPDVSDFAPAQDEEECFIETEEEASDEEDFDIEIFEEKEHNPEDAASESAPAEQEIPTVQAEPVGQYPPDGYADPNYANQGQYPPYGAPRPPYGAPRPPYGARPPYNPNQPPYNGNRNPYSGAPYAQGGYRPAPNPAPAPAAPVAPPEKKKNNRGLKVFTAIVCVLLAISVLFSGVLLAKYNRQSPGTNNPPSPSSPSTNEPNSDGPSLNIASSPATVEGALTTAEIAEKVKPSIVGIVVYTSNSGSSAGEGTGVIMAENDAHTETYIVTCAHVISDPGIKVKVQTEDGTSYDATIVGFDSRTDLGVVKISATGLPAAEFGDSDNLRVGDNVFAIGNPGGVEFFGSFTGGYVSAIDRPVSSEIGYTMKCIQHDAAINPGNSGGALVNVYGQVIGINSQKIAATDYEGMGFAIPVTSAKSVIDNLIKYGYVPNRPKLGITYYPVSASTQYSMVAQIQGLPAGALIIDQIDDESSLANTEARRYDMIIAVDGKELTTADVLLERIDNGKVGDKMTLTLCRVNSNYTISKFDVTITLVEDRGGSMVESTEPDYVDPFEYFNPFGE